MGIKGGFLLKDLSSSSLLLLCSSFSLLFPPFPIMETLLLLFPVFHFRSSERKMPSGFFGGKGGMAEGRKGGIGVGGKSWVVLYRQKTALAKTEAVQVWDKTGGNAPFLSQTMLAKENDGLKEKGGNRSAAPPRISSLCLHFPSFLVTGKGWKNRDGRAVGKIRVQLNTP